MIFPADTDSGTIGSPRNETPRSLIVDDPSRNDTRPRLLDEARLMKIQSQPGVIAVSAFYEGFPVQSVGNGDFEHVAALAEDFFRAGTKIARDMGIGSVDQLILETAGNKCIIAPCGDLSLCILTTADAQLGLIRVVLRSIQKEVST
ncbi:MAG TPA: roadblock/LC7 domain-containing protein [Methanoregula sp.]|nr:roadblock/LC7 domain-containing protein [Methanoregula sp.]